MTHPRQACVSGILFSAWPMSRHPQEDLAQRARHLLQQEGAQPSAEDAAEALDNLIGYFRLLLQWQTEAEGGNGGE